MANDKRQPRERKLEKNGFTPTGMNKLQSLPAWWDPSEALRLHRNMASPMQFPDPSVDGPAVSPAAAPQLIAICWLRMFSTAHLDSWDVHSFRRVFCKFTPSYR